jgi:signal transduction histidine kinase/CheY-like chemotaxis protein
MAVKRTSALAPQPSDWSSFCLAITEFAPLPMATVEGANHIVRYVNPAFCRLMDQPIEQLIGKPFSELLPEKDECVTLLDRVFRTGKSESHTGQEPSNPHSAFWSYTIWPVMADEGPVGVMIQVTEAAQFHERMLAMNEALTLGALRQHELTEAAEQARREADQANRLKDEFLATVSHELRTPLNAILGWAEMLRRGGLEQQTAAHGIETIARNAKAQNQLISDLLDVSRIISGQLRFEAGGVELIPIIEAALDTVRPAANAKGVQLRRRLDPAAELVWGDASRLQQIVWNLLTNAVKFTSRNGRVDVRLKRNDTSVVLIVSDTGEGISPEFLPYIFDRFRQAEGTTTRQHGGLGLGLAIVRHLVEAHGGTVRAASKGVGKGATFTVTLPLIAVGRFGSDVEHADAGKKAADDRVSSILTEVRVLVVDDEADARELLTIALTQCGAEVRAAATVNAALDILDEWQPDLLVSDIGMPSEDGYQLIRRVRARESERGGAIPALALTGYASSEDAARALAAGYQTHMAKPVAPSELVAKVASLVVKARHVS